jgi:hypothetical protein
MNTLPWSASVGEKLCSGSSQRCHLKKPPWPRPSTLPSGGPTIASRRTSEFWMRHTWAEPLRPLAIFSADGRALNAT